MNQWYLYIKIKKQQEENNIILLVVNMQGSRQTFDYL